MILTTKALRRVLQQVFPAVAPKDLVPEFCCAWFVDGAVIAYDEIIGIKVPFKSPLRGGVKAAPLLKFLKASRSRLIEVEVSSGGGMVEFAAGEARLTLELLSSPTIDFATIFDPAPSISLSADFITALPPMLVSVGGDTTMPDQLGVTVIRRGNEIDLFSTDSNTVSAMMIAAPEGWPDQRVCLPTMFCRQLVALEKAGARLGFIDKPTIDATGKPEISHEVIAASVDNIQLWAKLVEVDRPFNFYRMVDKHLPADCRSRIFPISLRFKRAIDVASRILDAMEGDPVRISVDGEILRVYATYSRDTIIDAMWLEKPEPSIEIFCNPVLIRRAFAFCDSMALTEIALIMSGSRGLVYFISLLTEKAIEAARRR